MGEGKFITWRIATNLLFTRVDSEAVKERSRSFSAVSYQGQSKTTV